MLLVAVEPRWILFAEVVDAAVNAHAGVAFPSDVFDFLAVLALAALDDGGQDLDAGALGQFQDAVHHLVHALLRNLAAALGAMGMADTGEEQAEVVVDLRRRGYRRAGVLTDGLLLNGYGRR